MNKVPYFKRLSTKISMSFILSSILIIFILSIILYSQSYKMVIKSASEKSFKISETVAKNIDMNGFENLKSKNDEQSSTYKRINKEFNYIRKITGARYIYTIRKDDKGKYEYVVDGLDINDKDISHIGDESEEYEGYEDVYNGKRYANNKIEIWNNDIIISSYYPLKNKMGKVIGFIGVDYDVKTEYLRLKEIKNTIILLSIILSVISIIYGFYFSRKITRPIVVVSRIANKISNYDLNVEKIENISSDEIGILSNTFNIMIDNLKDMIKGIKNIAEIIDKDSVNMNASMQQALASIENINENIGEISGGSEKTSNDICELNDIILNSNEFSNNVVENTKKAIDVSVDMKSSAYNGNIYVENIISKINNIGHDIEETEFVINELNNKTKNINEIIKIINKISQKTKMLALNANIEASRAGESGRGFAIVANEVKTLSDQTNIYADEINATIISVLESTEKIIESMNNVKISVKENVDTGIITKKVFDELVGKINNTDILINGISNLVKKQLANSENILDKSETVSEISQETTASCQSTMAISEKIKEDIYNIAQSTDNLMNICNELNNVVDKFKI